MKPFKLLLPIFGNLFLIGAGVIAYDLISMGYRALSTAPSSRRTSASATALAGAPPVTGWGRYLTGYEAGLWLLGMWFFGAIITFGLLSFNLEVVRAGDPTLPYLMASVGYSGLLIVTLLFVWRFLASLHSREYEPASVPPTERSILTQKV